MASLYKKLVMLNELFRKTERLAARLIDRFEEHRQQPGCWTPVAFNAGSVQSPSPHGRLQVSQPAQVFARDMESDSGRKVFLEPLGR